MTSVAFIGLGHMGAPMAGRLLAAGHHLTVWNRTPSRATALAERGAVVAGSPAEAAAGAEVAITMLADPPALEAVAFGPGGLAAGLRPGAALIEMSTVGPAAVRSLADRLGGGVAVLDAPVRGSVPEATDGRLLILVGGHERDVERWRPLLAVLGEPRHVGPPGAGAALKLVVNSVTATLPVLLAEALALADALGVGQELALGTLAGTPLAATVRRFRDQVAGETGPVQFALDLAAKDLGLAVEAAAATGLELRLAAAAAARQQAAVAGGLGRHDLAAVIPHVRGRTAASDAALEEVAR